MMQKAIYYFSTMDMNDVVFNALAISLLIGLIYMVVGKPIQVKTTYISYEEIEEDDEYVPARRPQFYDQHKRSNMFMVFDGSKNQDQS